MQTSWTEKSHVNHFS